MTYDSLKTITLKLLAYCQANDWAGYDPYDALNSPLLKYLPFLNFRFCRIALTQALKRSPINLRPLLLIPKTENPKAIALFLMAFLKLRKMGFLENNDLITLMTQKLINLQSPINPNNPMNPSNPYWCWGYSFPWQTRTISVPRGVPNLVCTSFVASALLDAYEENREPRCLSEAINAAEYILNELYWTEDSLTAGFSYPLPSLRSRVHNANFLGAALLCRTYKNCGEKKFLEPALKVARYSVTKQHDDGSWDYGESSTQHWVDNFHTGYNLCALRSISHYSGTTEFEPHIRRGFEFYRKHFFREDGAPKYFHDRTYPIDIHSVAQSIITLLAFKDLDKSNVSLAHAVFRWAMRNIWDEQGYFYYQVFPVFTSKIPYMRWSQAWMLLALSILLEYSGKAATIKQNNLCGGESMRSDSAATTLGNPGLEKGCNLTYALITPARNEDAFIEQTIKSVIGQTVLPARWIIVSDGSTDSTDEIVKKYAAKHQWIDLVRMPERQERHFAGKVHAFNTGYAKVKDLGCDIIGNLDADITFEREYFSFLLAKFAENSRLGVGGTPFREESHQYDYRFTSAEHVSGACQLFRRECFDAIGGYVPLKVGGEDLVAVITARMKGWQTRTFTERACEHHRKTQSGRHTTLMATFRSGHHDYFMGSSPLWQILRSVYQMSRKPFVIGGCFLLVGYVWGMVTRVERPVSTELVHFRRREQMDRLKQFFRNVLFLGGRSRKRPDLSWGIHPNMNIRNR